MKCPKCNNEMVHSHAGWLCLSCGHIEKSGPSADLPDVAPEQGSHGSVPPAPAQDKPQDAKVENEVLPDPEPAPKPEPAEPAESAEPLSDPPADYNPEAEPEADSLPEAQPEPDPAPEPPTELPPDETPEPNSVPEVEPEPEPETSPEPAPEPAPEPLPPSEPPDPPDVPQPPASKPPLTPTTHPRSTSSGLVAALIIIVATVGLAGGTLAYAANSNPTPLTWISAPAPKTVTPEPTVAASAPPSPSASPSASPAPPNNPAAAAARDTQRQTALAAYVVAYRATGANGFYAVSPPAVTVAATDPTTGQAYVVSTNPPTTFGQIQYQPGGVCAAANVTPGKTATHYIALKLKLETSPTLYCLEVK